MTIIKVCSICFKPTTHFLTTSFSWYIGYLQHQVICEVCGNTSIFTEEVNENENESEKEGVK